MAIILLKTNLNRLSILGIVALYSPFSCVALKHTIVTLLNGYIKYKSGYLDLWQLI